MNKKWSKLLVVVISSSLMLSACGQTTATPVPPTATPVPTHTPVPPTATPVPTDTPAATPDRPMVREKDGAVMVYVPGGAFQMGSSEAELDAAFARGTLPECLPAGEKCQRDWFAGETPQHTVNLDPFWIDQTEVSVAHFRRFEAETSYETEAEREGGAVVWTNTGDEVPGASWQHPEGPDSSAQDGHPVVLVSWNDAAAYCAWAGARLPTEAEWEYTARGPDGNTFPWGDEFDCTRSNFDDEAEMDSFVIPGGEGCDGYAMTAPVGSFESGASWCGALDMSGNVWEWQNDWYGDYAATTQTNPIGPAQGGHPVWDGKVLRGGSWVDIQRPANRVGLPPDFRNWDVGFRCAAAATAFSP